MTVKTAMLNSENCIEFGTAMLYNDNINIGKVSKTAGGVFYE